MREDLESGHDVTVQLLECASAEEFELKLETFGLRMDSGMFMRLVRGLPEHAQFVGVLTKLVSSGALDDHCAKPYFDCDWVMSGKASDRAFMRFAVLDEYVDNGPYLDYDWPSGPTKEAREKAGRAFAEDMKRFFSAVVGRIEAAFGAGIPSVENFKRRRLP